MQKTAKESAIGKAIILYHADCWDGYLSAWHAANALRKGGIRAVDVPFAEIVRLPVQHSDPVPKTDPDATLVILDFSFDRETMLELMRRHNGRFLLIDHHQAAIEKLEGLFEEFSDRFFTQHEPVIVLDKSRSAAALTWDFFHRGETAPSTLTLFVEDRDLWNWSLPNSREVNARMRTEPLNDETMKFLSNSFDQEGSGILARYEREGALILRMQEAAVLKAAEKAGRAMVDGWSVPFLNTTTLVSEIGEELAKSAPFSLTYFIRADGRAVFSLRSRKKGGVNVKEIAVAHGGGGHDNAAGFSGDLLDLHGFISSEPFTRLKGFAKNS